jgi:hypothetical protein
MPTSWSRLLANATPADRQGWRLVAGGCGIAWPALGEIVSLRAVWASEGPASGQGEADRGVRQLSVRDVTAMKEGAG